MSKAQPTQWTPPPIDLGLFFWNSDRDETEKRAITAWYRSLGPVERGYVDALREEERDDTEFNLNERDW